MEIHSQRFTVCLISTSNLDLFPTNTRTFFTNTVPLALSNFEQKELYVRLRSVGLSVDKSKPAPGYVKIQLHEMEEQASGYKKYDRVLGGFEYPQDSGFENYVFKTFGIDEPFLPLRIQIVSQLRIIVTDVHDRIIDIESGAPTVILLEVVTEDEMREQNSFCVTCTSYQPDMFVGNTLGHFTCPLPETIELKNYEVALSSVVFPTQMTEECTAHFQVEEELYVYNLMEMADIGTLMKKMNRDLQYGDFGRELKFIRRLYRNDAGRTALAIALVRKEADEEEDYKQQPYLQVRMSWTFSRVMGELENRQRMLMLKPGERYIFSGGEPTLFAAIPNPVAILSCDAVQTSWVGGQLLPILNCVPIRIGILYDVAGGTAVKMHEPNHLHYVNVKETPFDTISFQFLNPGVSLEQRLFTSPDRTDAIVITLAFRPKRT